MGHRSMYDNITGKMNVAIGYSSLENSTGDNNTALGSNAGKDTTGDKGVFLGFNAGSSETTGEKLYIENSNADATGALIYGEFDNDILRTNAEFQIGDPAGTGYKFPTARGTDTQVIQTDGSGQLSWVDTSTLSLGSIDLHADVDTSTTAPTNGQVLKWDGTNWTPSDDIDGSDADFYKEGTTDPPDNINDDIYTMGNLAIGKTNAIYPIDVETEDLIAIGLTITGSDNIDKKGLISRISNTGDGNHISVYSTTTGNGGGKQYGFYSLIDNTGDSNHYGSYSYLSGSGNGYQIGYYSAINESGTGINVVFHQIYPEQKMQMNFMAVETI